MGETVDFQHKTKSNNNKSFSRLNVTLLTCDVPEGIDQWLTAKVAWHSSHVHAAHQENQAASAGTQRGPLGKWRCAVVLLPPSGPLPTCRVPEGFIECPNTHLKA